MGELTQNYCEVVYTLTNKTFVVCVDKAANMLSSGVFGYSNKDYKSNSSKNLNIRE